MRRRKLKKEKKWFHIAPLSSPLLGNPDGGRMEEGERATREVGDKSEGVVSLKASEGVFQRGGTA